MTRTTTTQFHTFGIVALYILALTLVFAITAPAQQTAKGQPSHASSTVSTSATTTTSSRVGGAVRVSMMRSQGGSATEMASGSNPLLLLFLPLATYSSGFSVSIAVGDLNGDGKPDLVEANCGNDPTCTGLGSVSVQLGNGDGTFQPAVTYSSGGYVANSIALADVNGDGKPDLIFLDDRSGTQIGVALNTSKTKSAGSL